MYYQNMQMNHSMTKPTKRRVLSKDSDQPGIHLHEEIMGP